MVTREQRPRGVLDRTLSAHRPIAGALHLPHGEEWWLCDPAALARER